MLCSGFLHPGCTCVCTVNEYPPIGAVRIFFPFNNHFRSFPPFLFFFFKPISNCPVFPYSRSFCQCGLVSSIFSRLCFILFCVLFTVSVKLPCPPFPSPPASSSPPFHSYCGLRFCEKTWFCSLHGLPGYRYLSCAGHVVYVKIFL